jgi:exonuclease III
VVRELVRDTRPTIVTLQETKLDHLDKDLVSEILGSDFMENFVFLPAQNTRGGILLAVHEDHYKIHSSDLGVHSVTATIQTCTESVEWSITAVYGPQGDNEKLQFLGELRWVRHSVTDKWLILGDFNLILQAEDKSNDNLNRRLMGAFRDVVRDLELKELNLRGRKFTWSNDRTQTRIDRAFCTSAWDLMLPNVSLQALSSRVSDHCPVLLAGNGTASRFRGFRFESFWPKLEGYHQVVQNAWEQEVHVFNPFLSLHVKLKRTSKALKAWAKTKLGKTKFCDVPLSS